MKKAGVELEKVADEDALEDEDTLPAETESIEGQTEVEVTAEGAPAEEEVIKEAAPTNVEVAEEEAVTEKLVGEQAEVKVVEEQDGTPAVIDLEEQTEIIAPEEEQLTGEKEVFVANGEAVELIAAHTDEEVVDEVALAVEDDLPPEKEVNEDLEMEPAEEGDAQEAEAEVQEAVKAGEEAIIAAQNGNIGAVDDAIEKAQEAAELAKSMADKAAVDAANENRKDGSADNTAINNAAEKLLQEAEQAKAAAREAAVEAAKVLGMR
uniref:Uncharacterized abhydrolase domain-containing protein DDB_G0269086-like n=1 Tax=Saccoglossus kowalevskii TaxID=10224 RepID=A0ABM0ML05_SACKO|nr:PREDICTED: uncharacterized abhydrolase domain-containing protein DDB_G0269086-like [Saccoglossus kowalevskii]